MLDRSCLGRRRRRLGGGLLSLGLSSRLVVVVVVVVVVQLLGHEGLDKRLDGLLVDLSVHEIVVSALHHFTGCESLGRLGNGFGLDGGKLALEKRGELRPKALIAEEQLANGLQVNQGGSHGRHQLGDHPDEVSEMMDEELGQVGDTDLQHTAQSIDGSLVGVVNVLGVDGMDFGLEDAGLVGRGRVETGVGRVLDSKFAKRLAQVLVVDDQVELGQASSNAMGLQMELVVQIVQQSLPRAGQDDGRDGRVRLDRLVADVVDVGTVDGGQSNHIAEPGDSGVVGSVEEDVGRTGRGTGEQAVEVGHRVGKRVGAFTTGKVVGLFGGHVGRRSRAIALRVTQALGSAGRTKISSSRLLLLHGSRKFTESS